jgi:Protein of unknown function (DUF1524)
LTTPKSILQDLQTIYLDDETFRNYFELASFDPKNGQQKKVLRYILYKIEAQFVDGVKADYELDEGTIEHIMTKDITVREWNPTTLRHRQEKLGKVASGIWRINF